MSINCNSHYMIMLDGEQLIPEFIDSIMDYWTAETVVEFIKLIDASKKPVIKQVIFVDDDPKAIEKRARWEVLT